MFSYSISAVYTSANFIYVCVSVYDSPSIVSSCSYTACSEKKEKRCKVIVQKEIGEFRINAGQKEV